MPACLKIVLIHPPATVAAVDEQQNGKNVAKLSRYIGQSIGPGQQICPETKVKNGHSNAKYQHRVAKLTVLANTFIGGHERSFLFEDAKFGRIGGFAEMF